MQNTQEVFDRIESLSEYNYQDPYTIDFNGMTIDRDAAINITRLACNEANIPNITGLLLSLSSNNKSSKS